ncbi:lipoma-preferred partner-like isoform X1 [Pleurodeles waltl]|uniref:lipoma-preferred partner-like isoform X1 n=2 Tax=Pleurodeles waltl TaxID=8319 RepID=UPI003709A3F0
MSGPTWLPPKHLSQGEQAGACISVSAPPVFKPQRKFATIPVPKSHTSSCEQNGGSGLRQPPPYYRSPAGGFTIPSNPDSLGSQSPSSEDFSPHSHETTEHYYPAVTAASEGQGITAWDPGNPSWQMQGISLERGSYRPSSIDAEIDSLTSMLADMESSGPRRQPEPQGYDAMTHSSGATHASHASKASTAYKPKQVAYGATANTGSYGMDRKTSGYGASPQAATYSVSSTTNSSYNPSPAESHGASLTGGYGVSQLPKPYPQPMPASYTTASSSTSPAFNVQVKVAQPVTNYSEPRRKAEQAYGPPSPRHMGSGYTPQQATDPPFRAQQTSEQSYRGPQAMESPYRGPSTMEPSYRGHHTTEPSYRGSPTMDPSYRGPQANEQSFRGPHTNEPPYRGPQNTEYSYRMQSTEPPYRGPQAAEPPYRGPQAAEPPYRGPQAAEPPYRGPQAAEPPYRGPQAAEPPYRGPQAAEPPYRGPQAAEPPYRGPQAAEPPYRGPQAAEPPYRGPQAAEPPYRGPQAAEAMYRGPQAAEPSYRGPTITEPPYRAPQTVEPSYRGPQASEPSYRGPQASEPSYRGPQASEPSYRGLQMAEPSYREPQSTEQAFRGSQPRGMQGNDLSYRTSQNVESSYRGPQTTELAHRASLHNADVSNRAQQSRYPEMGPGQNWYQTSSYPGGADSGYSVTEVPQDRKFGQLPSKKAEGDQYSAGTKVSVQQPGVVSRVNREQTALSSGGSAGYHQQGSSSRSEEELDRLTKKLVHDMNHPPTGEYFGRCSRCGENVVGDGTGCIAMDQVFHEDCFTCISCNCRLRGQPFYAIEKKSYCEACYIVTLEKCSMCAKPILDRILRAMGQAYHPQCFICVVCRRCLDGVPFTVDATSQIHCIDDFHRKFAPRCSVCGNAIMPEPGQEETVRIVALDRSFHINCYKCEECGLLLSSEGEGRGCYPLDGHILCKSCSARRIQELSSKITTDC